MNFLFDKIKMFFPLTQIDFVLLIFDFFQQENLLINNNFQENLYASI